MSACYCIGPQNGEPLCPCRMGNVQIKDGRYVQVIDHGPVPLYDRDYLAWNFKPYIDAVNEAWPHPSWDKIRMMRNV